MSNNTRRKNLGLGATANGGSSGSFAAHSRDAGAPPAQRTIIGYSSSSPDASQVDAARLHLAEVIPGYREALESPKGSIPGAATTSAAYWKASGEPDEICKLVFDHDRLHTQLEDRGAPAHKRRKCVRCSEAIADGTGRKVYWAPQQKTMAMCDSCAGRYEFRPPMPERTVDNRTPIYAAEDQEYDEPDVLDTPASAPEELALDALRASGRLRDVNLQMLREEAEDNRLVAWGLEGLESATSRGDVATADRHLSEIVSRVEMTRRIAESGVKRPLAWSEWGSDERQMWLERQNRHLGL